MNRKERRALARRNQVPDDCLRSLWSNVVSFLPDLRGLNPDDVCRLVRLGKGAASLSPAVAVPCGERSRIGVDGDAVQPGELWSIVDLCRWLGRSRATVDRWVAKGLIPGPRKEHGRVLFDAQEVVSWWKSKSHRERQLYKR